jgi:protein-L-isoaspartate O-methyltransferase
MLKMQFRRYEAPLRGWIKKSPLLRSVARRARQAISRERVSTELAVLDTHSASETAQALRSAWQDASIPTRQATLVQRQLEEFKAALPVPVFDTLVAALRPQLQTDEKPTLLEIGCSSGYYSEVLQIKGLAVDYTGCDYSEAFADGTRMLRICASTLRTQQTSATKMVPSTSRFQVPACSTFPSIRKQSPRRRGLRGAAVFHRTPVYHTLPHASFTKKAYGVKTIEIHFNERELISALLPMAPRD